MFEYMIASWGYGLGRIKRCRLSRGSLSLGFQSFVIFPVPPMLLSYGVKCKLSAWLPIVILAGCHTSPPWW